MFLFFFFNDTATTEIYTLSLHDALPISWCRAIPASCTWPRASGHQSLRCSDPPSGSSASSRIARGRPYWSARSTAVPAPRRAPPPARSATIAVLRTSLQQRWPPRWSASSRDPGDHCRGGALDRLGRGRRPGTQAGGPVRAVARRALRRGAPAAAPRVGQEPSAAPARAPPPARPPPPPPPPRSRPPPPAPPPPAPPPRPRGPGGVPPGRRA